MSRREFAAIAAAAPLAFGRRASALAAPTASEIVDRIRQQIGVPWKSETVDGVSVGDPATPVTGIVTTSMATMAVLQQAVKARANVVVSIEPTFFSRTEARTPAGDPIMSAKDAFITSNRLVVCRLRDHWRLRRPDPFAAGLAGALGWTRHQSGDDPSRYVIPETRLDALARDTKQRLQSRGGIRVIGAPDTRVSKAALLPGSTPIAAALATFPDVDVVVAGEVREWESVEYVRDLVEDGQRKALILVGRLVSEDPGMRLCADWLKTVVPEVPVTHIGVGDPYWRPA